MAGERQSWAEFKVRGRKKKKAVISALTIFLSKSILCPKTQIIGTRRGLRLPLVAHRMVLLGVCVAGVQRHNRGVGRGEGN